MNLLLLLFDLDMEIQGFYGQFIQLINHYKFKIVLNSFVKYCMSGHVTFVCLKLTPVLTFSIYLFIYCMSQFFRTCRFVY